MGAKKQTTIFSKREACKAVQTAFQKRNDPSGEGMKFFEKLKISITYGFSKDLPIVERRLALNRMLFAYNEQLGRLQPTLAQVLNMRFGDERSIRNVSFSLHLSTDRINRMQRDAINFLADLILDDETRLRRHLRKRSSENPV